MKNYKVVGAHPVFGHAPGETFSAELDEQHETMLIEAGHLSHAGKSDPQPDGDDD